MILEVSKADFCQQAAPRGNAWLMALNETVFIAAVAILLLSWSMVAWAKPLQAHLPSLLSRLTKTGIPLRVGKPPSKMASTAALSFWLAQLQKAEYAETG